MDWYEVTDEYHRRTFAHEGRLSPLPAVWQREMAALWRLEADVNNGAYLQFLVNWGRECYVYASQGLKRIGALKMAEIIDQCQALIDEHCDCEGKSTDELERLLMNPVIDCEGEVVKDAGSSLPEAVAERIGALSYDFMGYPDDLAMLGLRCYGRYVEHDREAT